MPKHWRIFRYSLSLCLEALEVSGRDRRCSQSEPCDDEGICCSPLGHALQKRWEFAEPLKASMWRVQPMHGPLSVPSAAGPGSALDFSVHDVVVQ